MSFGSRSPMTMLHAFGHIHDEPAIRNFGVLPREDTIFVNCSCCDVGNRLVNHGVVFEIDASTSRTGRGRALRPG
jgi:hypothetical protein